MNEKEKSTIALRVPVFDFLNQKYTVSLLHFHIIVLPVSTTAIVTLNLYSLRQAVLYSDFVPKRLGAKFGKSAYRPKCTMSFLIFLFQHQQNLVFQTV